MILDDNCDICTYHKPRAITMASQNQLRYIEYKITEEGSYNYDIIGIPYFILEDMNDAVITEGCGGLGLDTIEKKLKE
tara:strand:+ start:132 stop:365 length:234 start_codon:yes stop_codon:yes gene_type:complete